MGFGQNILVFSFLIGVLLFFMGYNTTIVSVAGAIGLNTTTGQFSLSGSSIYIAFAALFGIFAIVVGTIFFPNPYTLFSGFALLLAAFSTIFYDMIQTTNPPFEVKIIVGGFFGLLMLLSAVVFIKAGEW